MFSIIRLINKHILFLIILGVVGFPLILPAAKKKGRPPTALEKARMVRKHKEILERIKKNMLKNIKMSVPKIPPYQAIKDLRPVKIRVGEVMRFDVTALNIVVVKIYLWVMVKGYRPDIDNGKRPVYKVKMIARTQGLFNRVYPIDDRLVTYLDAKTLLPVLVYKNLSEGNYQNRIKVVMDHQSGWAYYSDRRRKLRNVKFRIYPQTLDLVGLFYFIRRFPKTPGNSMQVSYAIGPSISVTTVQSRRRLVKAPLYYGDRESRTALCFRQTGGHGLSASLSADRWRVPVYLLGETMQFASRVIPKGYDISKFSRMEARLAYYAIQKTE